MTNTQTKPLHDTRNLVPRLWTILATIAAAAAVGAITEGAFGHDLVAPGMDIGLGTVVTVAALAGIAAVASLAVIERRSQRPHRLWRWLATIVLVISLGGPLSGTGVDAVDRVVLLLLHLVVGVPLIVGLPRSAENR